MPAYGAKTRPWKRIGKLIGGWIMRMCLAVIAMLTLNGCVTGPRSDSAVCARTEEPSTALAAALVMDGGPQSKGAGRTLIATLDAGCDR